MYEESVLMPWELEGLLEGLLKGLLKGDFASYEACSAEASGWMCGRGRGGNEDEDVDAALMASSRSFRVFSL